MPSILVCPENAGLYSGEFGVEVSGFGSLPFSTTVSF
jgi:hypothetical protein